MKAIKSELSDLNDGADDDDVELENRLKEADLPDDVRKKAESEFKSSNKCQHHHQRHRWYEVMLSGF